MPIAAEERRRVRESLVRLGLAGHQLLEPLVAEFRQLGCRPRTAWRYANEFTQSAVAGRYNENFGGSQAPMKPSRISEYEAWPLGKGARPSITVLKNLAVVYGTTWDRLVDLVDIEHMPSREREELREVWANRADRRAAVFAGGDLPAEVPNFTEREGPQAALRDRIMGHLQGRKSGLQIIDGPPGVGKTVLARYAVAAFARNYPDGSCWVDMHGHTVGREPRKSYDALERLLQEIGVPRETIETDPIARAQQWRAAMSWRRMLIVFDNVLDSDQVKSLLPQSIGSFVLITGRGKLTGLPGSAPLHLGVMDPDEAEELLVKLADLPPGYDAEAMRQILVTAGGLPLAIRLIAGRIAQHGADALADSAIEFANLTARLKQSPDDYPDGSAARTILDRFAAESESLLAAYQVSYQRLRDPVQRRALRLLGWFPGAEITADTIAMSAAMSKVEATGVLRKLFEAGFLDYARTKRFGGPRYRMHDLTKLFARSHAEQEDSPADQRAVLARLIGGYLAVVRQLDTLTQSAPGVGARHAYPEDASASAEQAQADGWVVGERGNLLACIRAAELTAETAELARRLAPALWGLGRWTDAQTLYDKVLQVARHIGDRPAEAGALLALGRIDQVGGDYRVARTGFQLAREIAAEVGDPRLQAEALCELGRTAWLVGEHGGAERYYGKALRVARAIDHPPAECDARNGLGLVEHLACNYDAARQHFQKAAEIAVAIGDGARAASVLWGDADVVRRMGDTDTARRKYTDALRMARRHNHPQIECDALRGLGHAARYEANWDAARRYYTDALEIATRIRDRRAEVWTLWGLGMVDRRTGEFDSARTRFAMAYDTAVELNLIKGQVDILRGLGHIERHYSRYDAARQRYIASLDIADRINDRHGRADALRSLGRVFADTGLLPEARTCLSEAIELFGALGVPLAAEVEAELAQLVGDS